MRDNRSLKWGLISMGNCFCAKLLVLNSVGYSYSPWHDCPSPAYPSLQVQIWEPFVLLQFELIWQTWLPSLHSLTSANKNELPKRYLTEKNIKFLSFNGKSFLIICGKLYSATCLVKCNDYTLAWIPVSSVSFLTGADIRPVSVSTVRIYVTHIASSAALVDAWGHK